MTMIEIQLRCWRCNSVLNDTHFYKGHLFVTPCVNCQNKDIDNMLDNIDPEPFSEEEIKRLLAKVNEGIKAEGKTVMIIIDDKLAKAEETRDANENRQEKTIQR